MNNNWKISDFDEQSKIWIYSINPNLQANIVSELENELTSFCTQWTAHSRELRAFYKLIAPSILILGVDEHLNPASGCSIDKSVHFLESLEKKYNVTFLNRMLFTHVDEQHQLHTCSKTKFEELLSTQHINSDSLIVNTLALSVKEWNENGIIPFGKSWMKNFFKIPV